MRTCINPTDCRDDERCVAGQCINVRHQPVFLRGSDAPAFEPSAASKQEKPLLAVQQEFRVPLTRYEKQVQDALFLGGSLSADAAAALGMVGDSQRSERFMLDVGRGVGLLGRVLEGQEIPQLVTDSSKGVVLVELVRDCQNNQRRCVVFTHLGSQCGAPAIKEIFKNCGIHEWSAGGSRAPFHSFAYVDPSQPAETFRQQQEAFNEGHTAFLLARNTSEGVQFEHVQRMIITEPTGSAVTWVQEIARVARLKTYRGLSYDLVGNYDAKVPHVIQLVSQGTAPAPWSRAVMTMFGLFSASSLMLTLTTAWTLAGKRIVRRIPARLTPAQRRESLRIVQEMQALSRMPGVSRIPGLARLSASLGAALRGDDAGFQEAAVRSVTGPLFAFFVLQNFVRFLAQGQVSADALERFVESVGSSAPGHLPEPHRTQLVTGRARRLQELDLAMSIDEMVRKECTTALARLRDLQAECGSPPEEMPALAPWQSKLQGFTDFGGARGRATHVIRKQYEQHTRETYPKQLLVYMAPGTGKSLVAWEALAQVLMCEPLANLRRLRLTYFSMPNTATNFISDGLTLINALLAEKEPSRKELLTAIQSGLTKLNTLNAAHSSEAALFDFSFVEYDVHNQRKQVQEVEKIQHIEGVFDCVIFDEAHNLTQFASDAEQMQEQPLRRALTKLTAHDKTWSRAVFFMTGTFGNVMSFCRIASLALPDDNGECAQYYQLPPQVQRLSKAVRTLVPILVLLLPAFEYYRGNSSAVALIGLPTAAYASIWEMQNWETRWASWDIPSLVKRVRPRLVFAGDVVQSTTLPPEHIRVREHIQARLSHLRGKLNFLGKDAEHAQDAQQARERDRVREHIRARLSHLRGKLNSLGKDAENAQYAPDAESPVVRAGI